jgi:small conductance mechanosensitive channel
VEEATAVLHHAAARLTEDPQYAEHFIDPPEVLGVEQITVDGAVVRTIAKTTADGQFPVGRELRRRLTEALENAGITAQMAAARRYPRPAVPPWSDGTGPNAENSANTGETGQSGPT